MFCIDILPSSQAISCLKSDISIEIPQAATKYRLVGIQRKLLTIFYPFLSITKFIYLRLTENCSRRFFHLDPEQNQILTDIFIVDWNIPCVQLLNQLELLTESSSTLMSNFESKDLYLEAKRLSMLKALTDFI